MRNGIIVAALLLVHFAAYAEETSPPSGADEFVRRVVTSLIEGGNKVPFAVAEKVFAIDNGEVLSKEDLKKAWPELAKRALKKEITADEFFRDAKVQIISPRENKRLLSDKRVLEVYQYQDGDLYCDASHVRDGVENFIGYDKAFIYIIRKIEGRWILIGIGG